MLGAQTGEAFESAVRGQPMRFYQKDIHIVINRKTAVVTGPWFCRDGAPIFSLYGERERTRQNPSSRAIVPREWSQRSEAENSAEVRALFEGRCCYQSALHYDRTEWRISPVSLLRTPLVICQIQQRLREEE